MFRPACPRSSYSQIFRVSSSVYRSLRTRRMSTSLTVVEEDLTLQGEFCTMKGILYRAKGDHQKKTPVLAVHGWCDNAASFRLVAPYLIDRYDIYAVDLIGHGHSEHRPKGSGYSFVHYCADVIEMLGKFEEEEVLLLGHSMGAGILSLVSAIVPEKAKKLVLVDGLGPLADDPEQCVQYVRDFISQRVIAEKRNAQVHMKSYPNIDDAARVRQQSGDLTFDNARILCERMLEKSDNDTYTWRADAAVRMGVSPMRLTLTQVTSFLQKVECPTLFLEADRGIFHPKAPGRYGQQQMSIIHHYPNMERMKLRGGHHLHMDNPADVASAIRTFFE